MQTFISLSFADRQVAQDLGREIANLGVSVCDPFRAIGLGSDWQAELRQALEGSDNLIIVVPSPGSKGANNAFFEAGAARALGKPVIAVLPVAEEERIRELPADLFGSMVVDGSKKPAHGLGVVQNLLRRNWRFWADSIVPFAMEVIAGEVDGLDFGVADLDAFGIGIGVEFAADFQARFRCRRTD